MTLFVLTCIHITSRAIILANLYLTPFYDIISHYIKEKSLCLGKNAIPPPQKKSWYRHRHNGKLKIINILQGWLYHESFLFNPRILIQIYENYLNSFTAVFLVWSTLWYYEGHYNVTSYKVEKIQVRLYSECKYLIIKLCSKN